MKRCGPGPASGAKVASGSCRQSVPATQASDVPSGPRASARKRTPCTAPNPGARSTTRPDGMSRENSTLAATGAAPRGSASTARSMLGKGSKRGPAARASSTATRKAVPRSLLLKDEAMRPL